MPLPKPVQDAIQEMLCEESERDVAIFEEMLRLNNPRPDKGLVETIAERHGATFEEILDIASRINEKVSVIITNMSSSQQEAHGAPSSCWCDHEPVPMRVRAGVTSSKRMSSEGEGSSPSAGWRRLHNLRRLRQERTLFLFAWPDL